MTRKCVKCGAAYAPRTETQRFCSKPCAAEGKLLIQGKPWPADLALPREARKRWYWRIRNAFSRCFNSNDVNYARYGARGVTVCRAWVKDPTKFLRYGLSLKGALDPALTLDRIDNDRGYEPGNLRMATKSQQMRNRPRYTGGCDPRVCRGCGGEFVPPLGRGYLQFCTRKCYLAWLRAKPKPCSVCGKMFLPPKGRNGRATCGKRCLKQIVGRYPRGAK